jgi:FlaA1/EpsC-like NDP-sugar epimerase
MIFTLSKKLIELRNRHFFFIDAIIFAITPLLALILRLDGSVALAPFKTGLSVIIVLFLTVQLSVFVALGVYKRYWRYASMDELTQIAKATAIAAILQTLIFGTLYSLNSFGIEKLPRSLPLLDGLLSVVLVGGLRFSIRELERISQKCDRKFHRHERVLIVGAGNAGVALGKEMQQSPWLGFQPVAFIDDDSEKLSLLIRRLPVVGNRYSIPEFVRSLQIRRVIIAMPSVPGRVIREITDICQSIGIQTSTLPGIHEILNGRVHIGSVRDIKIEDLLRREPIQTDIKKVSKLLRGKTVLITGAGGSIGSELCRQVFKCRPAEIVLLGHGENSVFNIQQELEQVLQSLNRDGEDRELAPRLTTLIADIRFSSRLEYVFEQYRPEIVFHAAAHKHVPMMELNPPEAITNNVRGTKNLLDLSLRYGVEHFVMISTDKAVNPTSLMGASKRVAEMLVLQAAQKSKKSFSVVRFGNVLGSRGSVVPTFRRQIAAGGPVTITHPDICRYFMTIPEAVQLVLQASVLGQRGEVFTLNMGQPIKIADLAKDLIRLSGYEVGKDIDIVYTGLRPGEKLFEELFIPGEKYELTEHEKIMTVHNAISIVPENLDFAVEDLCQAATQNDSNLIIFLLEQLVPGYTPKSLKGGIPASKICSMERKKCSFVV